MLVLSRHRDEVIVIRVGNEIVRVVPVEIRGDKVRLGFEAEQNVQIDREEVYESKLRNNPPQGLQPAA